MSKKTTPFNPDVVYYCSITLATDILNTLDYLKERDEEKERIDYE